MSTRDSKCIEMLNFLKRKNKGGKYKNKRGKAKLEMEFLGQRKMLNVKASFSALVAHVIHGGLKIQNLRFEGIFHRHLIYSLAVFGARESA